MFRFKILQLFRICQSLTKVIHRYSQLPNLTEKVNLSTKSFLLLVEITLNRAPKRVSSSHSSNALQSLRRLIRLAASSHRSIRAKSRLSRPGARALHPKKTVQRMCLRLMETIMRVRPMPARPVKVIRVTLTRTQSSTTSVFKTSTTLSSTLTKSIKSF